MSTHGKYDTTELRAYIDKLYDGDVAAFLSDFISTLDEEQRRKSRIYSKAIQERKLPIRMMNDKDLSRCIT